jgi:hypothetical protein
VSSFPSNSPPTGAFFTPSGGNVGGTNYTYALGSGSYQTSQFTVGDGGSVIVTGNVELYVNGDFDVAGSGYVWIAPGASLKIFVDGKFACGGGGMVNGTGVAANLSVLGLNGCGTCTYSGSSEFVGTINAPNAAVSVSSSPDFYGAIVGSTIAVSGGGSVHYDEALANSSRRYVVDSWDEWAEF